MDVPAVVEDPLLSTALGDLLLLLLFDLGGLRLDLTGTGERAVNCSNNHQTTSGQKRCEQSFVGFDDIGDGIDAPFPMLCV